jgi:hypothetical protein
MTRRQSFASPAHSIILEAIISIPDCALTTIAAVSTASSAPIACPMKSGKPGVSITWIRVSRVSRCTTDARNECCQGLLERIEIARRGPALDRPRLLDRTGCKQQRFGKRRLSGAALPDQRDGADVRGGVIRHAFAPPNGYFDKLYRPARSGHFFTLEEPARQTAAGESGATESGPASRADA